MVPQYHSLDGQNGSNQRKFDFEGGHSLLPCLTVLFLGQNGSESLTISQGNTYASTTK